MTNKSSSPDPGCSRQLKQTDEFASSGVPEKLYPLVEAYLVDIFRQSVNLVGARHGEIFSQDHKRCDCFVPFPACIRVKEARRKTGRRQKELNLTVGEVWSQREGAAMLCSRSLPSTTHTFSGRTADNALLRSRTPPRLGFLAVFQTRPARSQKSLESSETSLKLD